MKTLKKTVEDIIQKPILSEELIVSILCTYPHYLTTFNEIYLHKNEDGQSYFVINGDPSSGLAEKISCYTKTKCVYKTGQIDRSETLFSIKSSDIALLKNDHVFEDVYEVYAACVFDENRHLTRLISVPACSAYAKWVIYSGPLDEFLGSYSEKAAVNLEG